MIFHDNIRYVLVLLLLGCNIGDLRHRVETTTIQLYVIDSINNTSHKKKRIIPYDSLHSLTDSVIIEWQNSLSWSQNASSGAGHPGYRGTCDSIESIKVMKENNNGIFDVTNSITTCSENLGFVLYPDEWSVTQCYSWRFDTIENWDRLLDRYKYENNRFNGESNFMYRCLECPLYLVLHMDKIHKENTGRLIYIVIKFRSGREILSNKIKII